MAGIGKQTFYNALKRAEAGDEAAQAFVDAVENAEAMAEAEMVGCVRNAAKKGPQYWAAGATFLERKSPERWGRRQDDGQAPKVVVQIGVHGQDVTVNVGGESRPEANPLVPVLDTTTTGSGGQLTERLLSDSVSGPHTCLTTEGQPQAGSTLPRGSRRASRRGTQATARAVQPVGSRSTQRPSVGARGRKKA